MKKSTLIIVSLILALFIGISAASAQVTYAAVTFDKGFVIDDSEVSGNKLIEMPGTVTLPEDQSVQLPGYADEPTKPTCEGYYFRGWLEKNTTGGYSYGTDNYVEWNFTQKAVPNDGLTLYGLWQKTYTLSYDWNLQSKDTDPVSTLPSDITVTAQDVFEVEVPNVLSGTGIYALKGWNLTNTWSTPCDFDSKHTHYNISEDTTLYGSWVIAPNVFYHPGFIVENNIVVKTMDSSRVKHMPEDEYVEPGQKIIRPADPTAKDYRFIGWMDRADETVPVDLWDFDNDTVPDQGVTLYALWEKDDGMHFYQYENDFWDDMHRRPCLPRTGFSTRLENPMDLSVINYTKLNYEIQIPSLNVAADLVAVPVLGGYWAVEGLADRAGLLSGSALPGEGISVIAAHNHLNASESGPFLRIQELKDSDLIFVSDANGEMKRFAVYANEVIGAEDVDTLQTIAEQETNSLVLLTCENESLTGEYINRRAIFAKPL